MEIYGEKITLRQMAKTDMADKVRWYNDPEINKTLLVDETFTLEKTIEWFEKVKNDETRKDFIIETKEGQPIGIAGLSTIDYNNKTAEIYCVIGEQKYWGKGVMFETERLLINWAFQEMGLEKIWAYVRPTNVASIITMKKLGFKIEGTLLKEKKLSGQRMDIMRVGLLKEEFRLI